MLKYNQTPNTYGYAGILLIIIGVDLVEYVRQVKIKPELENWVRIFIDFSHKNNRTPFSFYAKFFNINRGETHEKN